MCLFFGVLIVLVFLEMCFRIINPVLMSHGNLTFSPFLQHRQEVPAAILNFTLKRTSLPNETTQT